MVIVSWNVRGLLLRCLETLEAARLPTRVVVVDNASTDGSCEAVSAAHPGVRLIRNAENRGFTAANNQGLRALGVLGASDGGAPPPYTFLLNPDTELRPGALQGLVAALEADPARVAVGPLLRYGDGTVQSSRRRFPTLASGLLESTPLEWHWPDNPVARRYRMADVPPDQAQDVDWLNGAALLLRSEALAAVGGFDERFFMYSEEIDLCRRLRAAGGVVHFTPAAEVIHHEGRSSEQVVAARHLRFVRSRVRYFRKHRGRAAAASVRVGLRAQYALEWALEGAKAALGHKPELRRARMACYRDVVRGLGPERGG